VAWLSLIIVEYFSISYNVFDTGWFWSVVANLGQGRGFFNSFLQMPAFADHFSPVLALFVPFFKIWPSFLWLPLFRLLAYLACLPVLWRISGHLLRQPMLRWLVLAIWLTNAPLARVLSFEFQPSTLALPVILLAFLFAVEGRLPATVLCLVVLLGFKENMALVIVSVGAWMWFFGRRRMVGKTLVVAGITVGLLIVFVVAPLLSDGASNQHLDRFGPFELGGAKALFLLRLLASVGFIPLLAPRSLLVFLPACGLTLVSGMANMPTLRYHYHDVPTAVLFVTVILGLARYEEGTSWLGRWSPGWRSVAVSLFIALLVLGNHRYPSAEVWQKWPSEADLEAISELKSVRQALEPDTTLWALDCLAVYFSDDLRARTILKIEEPLNARRHHTVLLADHVHHWPIGEQYPILKQRLEESVRSGRMTRMVGLRRLIVYSSTGTDDDHGRGWSERAAGGVSAGQRDVVSRVP
jgi:uncharacterized membrane protein